MKWTELTFGSMPTGRLMLLREGYPHGGGPNLYLGMLWPDPFSGYALRDLQGRLTALRSEYTYHCVFIEDIMF